MYTSNCQKAYELVKDEYKMPTYNWRSGTYISLQDKFYEKVRYCRDNPYSLRATCSDDISAILSKSTNYADAVNKHGWIYRYPKGSLYLRDLPSVERLSLNIYPEPEFFEKIDKYLTKSGIKAYYKVPAENDQWLVRHETLIMYFEEKLSPEAERDLIKLITPHVRKSDEGTMLGKKLAEGIYKEVEPSAQDVDALIQRAKNLDFDPYLVDFLMSPRAHLYENYGFNGSVNTSPAICKSVELMLDTLEKLKYM